MFFIIKVTDIASYADDNTPCASADNIDGVTWSLEEASEILFKWVKDNLMKINADKCHLLVSKNNAVKKKRNFDKTNIKSEKLLGLKFDHKLSVKFDHKLSFNDYISQLCKKASTKIVHYQE